MNETLCPPTEIKAVGNKARVARARSIISGNIGEIIAGECDNVRPPVSNQPEKIPVRFALQINQTDRVARLSGSCGDKLKTQRLKTKINLRIHQTTRVNCE